MGDERAQAHWVPGRGDEDGAARFYRSAWSPSYRLKGRSAMTQKQVAALD